MNKRMKIELRRSAIRSRLAEITELPDDKVTEEIREERSGLMTEYRESEQALQAAIIAEESEVRHRGDQARGDGEHAELRRLESRASIGAVYASAIEHRQTDGEIGELQEHYGLPSNYVPVTLLREQGAEARAATPAPAHVGADEQPVEQPVFAMGLAAFLQVQQPMVMPGESVYPTLTTRPTVGGPHADSSMVNETDGRFDAEALAPERLQSAFSYRKTDAAKFRQMDAELRTALSEGLSEGLDLAVLNQIVADVARVDAGAAADDYAGFRSRLVYANIEGRHATMESDIRLALGTATHARMASIYRSNETDLTALMAVKEVTGGVRVSPLIEAPATAQKLQDAIVRLGSRRDAVCPLWMGIEIIDDPVTRAAQGERIITATLMMNCKVTRAAGFRRVQTRHA